ncbi:MAG: A/G-specific adenine glycosylase [Xanthomonadales bacterium]|nr:A/G-specific adenine glycosylase [Xanthomonadales bacterium]
MRGPTFAARLLHWFDRHGRHDLPWQHPRTPYRVWLSEVMLQQTRVATAVPYFERFVQRFPDIAALARSEQDDVLACWSGLGYYSRARNLRCAAQTCVADHDGQLPRTLEQLTALPGIGRSTAAAILAQAHGDRVAILDGNVKRVLARHAGIEGFPGLPAVERALWSEATSRLPQQRLADYTQALMDFGATVCTPRRPSCPACPLRDDCLALARDRVHALPTPKPRRAIPEREVVMLVLLDRAERVLFERRPPNGIWGGLLGLPEFASIDDALFAATRHGTTLGEALWVRTYRHQFTHFKLDIHPLLLQVGNTPAVAESTYEWHAREAFADLALPTAVRRVLELALRPGAADRRRHLA